MMEADKNKTTAYSAQERYGEKEQALLQKLRALGNDPDVLAELGHLHFDAYDEERAKSFFDQSLFFDRTNACASAGLLRLTAKMPLNINREELFHRIEHLDTVYGFLGRAGYYAGTGKPGLAVRETEQAEERFPDDRAVLMARIDALMRGNIDDVRIGDLIARVKALGEDRAILDTEMLWLYRTGRDEACLACCEAVAKSADEKLLKRASELKDKLKARRPVQTEGGTSGRTGAEAALQKMIGLTSVKEEIFRIKKKIEYNRVRQEKIGFAHEDDDAYHFVFSGNPGTGKTTVARLLGEILCDAGLLAHGGVVEVGRGDLVGEFQGATALKTKEAIEKAIGGILFIDEAYSLINGAQDNFGHEALDTLVKGAEDHRKELVVILAGYRDEMRELLSQNIGLESRFTRVIDFPDYTAEELLAIAKSMAADQHYVFSPDGELAFREKIEKKRVNKRFGNARTVRTLMEEAFTEKAIGFDPEESSMEYMTVLTPDDFGIRLGKDSAGKAEDSLKELDRLTGLKDVKYEIKSTVKIMDYIKQERVEGNVDNISFPNTLHLCFTGNPGTGKTTVARIYAKLLADIGIAKTGELIEASRGSMVGRYQGETALKTREICERAYGGVLFIDEAYDLVHGENDTFGLEAVAELIKQMEDNRDKLIVIFAGYSREMDVFMDSNSGIRSRLSKTIEFPDYSYDELCLIFDGLVTANRILTDEAVTEKAHRVIRGIYDRRDARFGNAREMRNLYDTVWKNMVNRVEEEHAEGDARRTFQTADFEGVN